MVAERLRARRRRAAGDDAARRRGARDGELRRRHAVGRARALARGAARATPTRALYAPRPLGRDRTEVAAPCTTGQTMAAASGDREMTVKLAGRCARSGSHADRPPRCRAESPRPSWSVATRRRLTRAGADVGSLAIRSIRRIAARKRTDGARAIDAHLGVAAQRVLDRSRRSLAPSTASAGPRRRRRTPSAGVVVDALVARRRLAADRAVGERRALLQVDRRAVARGDEDAAVGQRQRALHGVGRGLAGRSRRAHSALRTASRTCAVDTFMSSSLPASCRNASRRGTDAPSRSGRGCCAAGSRGRRATARRACRRSSGMRAVMGEQPRAEAERVRVLVLRLADGAAAHVTDDHVGAQILDQRVEVDRLGRRLGPALQQHLAALVEAEPPRVERSPWPRRPRPALCAQGRARTSTRSWSFPM